MKKTNQSNGSQHILDEISGEYFWGCELTKEKPEVTWSFQEEDNDQDFLLHTLFLKHAVLGANAVNLERNLVEMETTNFAGTVVKQPVFDLILGQQSSCFLDLSFIGQIPVTFRLVEGSGPIHMTGQHLVELPEEWKEQESLLQEVTDDEELGEAVLMRKSGPRKRKAEVSKATKKLAKLENSEADDDLAALDEDNDEDDDDDDNDDDGEDEVDEEDDDDQEDAEISEEEADRSDDEVAMDDDDDDDDDEEDEQVNQHDSKKTSVKTATRVKNQTTTKDKKTVAVTKKNAPKLKSKPKPTKSPKTKAKRN